MTRDPITRLNAALEARYRIERRLGEGGMATVYLADDLRHERKVALKVLKPELAAVVGAERFLAEIKTTANLQHPHILPLFDSGEADGFLFYVMPYVEGESLRERLDREHQLPVGEAVQIASDVAEALEYAHGHGVIHRDIKPANILLHAGRPLIADFGIALAVGAAGGGRLTETGLSLGTPHYMSPEQATGDLSVGAATDTYALGCVLYEMLVGTPPFVASTPQAVLGKIVTGDAPSATAERKSVPPNVNAAIRRALEKVPADRFASVQNFGRALTTAGFRHGAAAETGTAGSTGVRERVAVVASVSAATLAIALGWSLSRPPATQPVSVWEVSLSPGLALYSGTGVNLAVSPDGSTFVFSGVSEDRTVQLWLRRLDQHPPVPTPIPGTEGAQNPRFSPDGTSIAFTADDALSIVSIGGGARRTIVPDSVATSAGGLAWGPDDYLYYRTVEGRLRRIREGSGESEQVFSTAPEEQEFEWPDVLPGGRALLLTLDLGGPTDDSIAVLSLETGEVRTVALGAMARYANSGHILYASWDGTLMAVPFDARRLEMQGTPRAVLQGLEVNDSSAAEFAVSPNGVFAHRAGAGVVLGTTSGGGVPVWVRQDGSVSQLDPSLTGLAQAPAISPDGRRVALEYAPVGEERDIWVYDLEQGTLSNLTFAFQTTANRRPSWSPDGSEIAFMSGLRGIAELYVVASDGSEPTPRLLRAAVGEDADLQSLQEVVWSPDGSRIVYRLGAVSVTEQNFSGEAGLWSSAPHPDSAAQPFFDVPFAWYDPAFSPNGEWLAYASNESNRREVYVRRFPGAGARRQVSVEGGRSPVWSRDGRQLLYTDLNGEIVVASVQTSPEFAVTSREPHPEWPVPFSGNPTQHFDVAPDGRLLVIDASAAGTRARDVVVQNFFEVIRQRLGNN